MPSSPVLTVKKFLIVSFLHTARVHAQSRYFNFLKKKKRQYLKYSSRELVNTAGFAKYIHHHFLKILLLGITMA